MWKTLWSSSSWAGFTRALLVAINCTWNPDIGQQSELSATNDWVLRDLSLSSQTMKGLVFSQDCSLTATFNEDTYWDSQHLRWWDHQLSSAMKGALFFHPSSYWRLLRETARDELSQLKSLGLLNLVGWLAGQHCCNTEMTQPHSIFVGILLAAAETSISLLLNRVCQWLGALMWKM